jgi:hypothetical protein
MPKYQITGPDGKSFEVTAPDGATEDEVLAYAQKNFKMAAAPAAKPTKPFGQQLNDFVADVPRQVGMTGRYALEGLGGMADLVATPARAAMNLLPGVNIKPGVGQVAANMAGLPEPRTPEERVVGDATRMGFGAMGGVGAARQVAGLTGGVTQKVAQMMAANPGAQAVSGAAAGGAGGYTRETGGNDTSQLLASLGAGVAAPFALSGMQRALSATQAMGRAKPAPTPQQIDITINNALQDSGINLGQIPSDAARSIRADVAKAMQTGENLSPDAVRRLADYRLTGLTPTAAKLTLDPAAVTQQENLAKLGINSKDPVAQQLGQTKNANNRALVAGLNTLGAGTTDDAIAGAGKVMGALDARNSRAKGLIDQEYAAARDASGRSAALDPAHFTRTADDKLRQALLQGKLPGDIRRLMNQAAKGEMPLTVDVAEQFKTRLGEAARDAAAKGDKSQAKALGMVRSALDDTPLLPGQEIGKEAIDAFNKARTLNRKWMGIVEKTPALQAVRDGIEPDKFVSTFITGNGKTANVMDVAMLKNSIKSSPEAMDAVRTQIMAHLKKQALNGAPDEAANFSQSAFNKALQGIGERKLKLFFEPEAVDQLKALGRVARYEQFQPTGSAVNNSNTASAGMSAMLDRIGSSAMLSKIPFGKLAQEPIQNITIGMQAGKAMNVPGALTNGVKQPLLPAPRREMALSPAMFMGQEDEETKRRRQAAGLLFP